MAKDNNFGWMVTVPLWLFWLRVFLTIGLYHVVHACSSVRYMLPVWHRAEKLFFTDIPPTSCLSHEMTAYPVWIGGMFSSPKTHVLYIEYTVILASRLYKHCMSWFAMSWFVLRKEKSILKEFSTQVVVCGLDRFCRVLLSHGYQVSVKHLAQGEFIPRVFH